MVLVMALAVVLGFVVVIVVFVVVVAVVVVGAFLTVVVDAVCRGADTNTDGSTYERPHEGRKGDCGGRVGRIRSRFGGASGGS